VEWIILYLVFAIIVGVAANTRGRGGFGWFILAVLTSPLIAGLLVLALPRLNVSAPIKAETVFEADAVIAGIPYRIIRGGMIEAMTKNGLVRFRNMDQFRASAEGRDDVLQATSEFQDEVDGIRYKLNPDSTVTAMTPIGVQTYTSWASFRQATKTGKWTYRV
jgi:hypothetical protein